MSIELSNGQISVSTAHFNTQTKVEWTNLVLILGVMATTPKLLTELFLELAAELEQLLVELGEAEWAGQVSKLSVIDRCRCGGSA